MSINATSFLPKFNNNSIGKSIKPKVLVTLVFTPAELGIDQRKAPKTVKLTDQQIEKKLFESFGLNVDDAKKRLKTDNPFAKVETTGDNTFTYNDKTGKYEATLNVEKVLHKELSGKAVELKKQIADEKKAAEPKSPSNPNEAIAGKNGVNDGASQRTKLNKQLADAENAKQARLINDAQIIPTGITPRKLSDLQTFSVKVPEGTTADQKDKVLLSHIDKQYSDRIPFAQNRQNILAEAKLKGVDIQNVKIENGVATFDISVENMLKLHTSFIGERESINQAEAAYDKFANKNEISQFLSGLVTGSGKAIVGTANLVIDLPGTLNALYQVVSSPVETFNALYKELGETWDEFKNADSSKKANMIGELVGGAVTEFLIGKGIGKAAGILAKTKTGVALLAKAEKTAVAVTAKVANKFSDEAAGLAGERARKALATTAYSGIPVDILADMAVVAGNKIGKSVVRFTEFSKQMVAEFGDKIKPKLLELYQDAFEKVHGARKTLDLDELLGGHSIERHVGKSENWLRQRLLNEPLTKASSTFTDYATANKTVSRFVKENRELIEKWLESGSHRLEKDFSMDETIGRVLSRGKGNAPLGKAVETSKARLVLVRDKTPQGWHIETSFPIPSNGGFKW
jgi:Bacterial CdiA-CT RNAse A domain